MVYIVSLPRGCVLKIGNLKTLALYIFVAWDPAILFRAFLIYNIMQCLKCKIEKETREFQENEFLTRGYVDNCFECESIYYDYAMIQNKRN